MVRNEDRKKKRESRQPPKGSPTACKQPPHLATIGVPDDVKERLRDLKRNDESFNDLLERLSKTKTHVEEIVGNLSDIDDGDLEAGIQEAHDELNESIEPLF